MTTLAQFRRELLSIFLSPIAYVLLFLSILYNGVMFMLIVLYLSGPDAMPMPVMEGVFGGTEFFFILAVAAATFITMRLLAEEKRSGALETLLTAPIGELQVVLAKYTAAVVAYGVLWLPTLSYPIILSYYSDIDPGPLASGYLGTMAQGMMFLSVGLLCSALTRSQIVAALLSFAISMFLFMLGLFEFVSPTGASGSVIGYMQIYGHMTEFARGIVDSRRLVYYGSVTVFLLFATVQVLGARRWRG